MMLLSALTLRPTLHRPLRFAVTVVGVAVGIAAVVATVAASRAAVSALRDGVEAVSGADVLELTAVGGIDEEKLGALRPLAGRAAILPVIEEAALLPALGDAVRVLGLDLLAAEPSRQIDLLLPPGRSVAAITEVLTGRAALLPERLADRLGLAVGGELVLSVRGRRVTLPVAGTFRPRRVPAVWERIVVVDVAAAQELFGRVGRLDRIELLPRPGVAPESIRAWLESHLPPGLRVAPPAERAESASRMVRSLEFNLRALSAVSLFVGVVLVATTLATSVVQRRRLFALARTLGASRLQLTTVVLAEAAVIGLAGGAGGVVLGGLAARAALTSVRASVAAVAQDVPAAAIEIPPWLAFAGIGAGLAAALVAALLPMIEAWRTPPLQALAGERPTVLGQGTRTFALASVATLIFGAWVLTRLPALGELPIAALAGTFCVLLAALLVAAPLLDALARTLTRPLAALPAAEPFRLAIAAIAASRRRAAWATGAIAVAVALAVAVGTMVSSFRVTVVRWTEQGMHSDLWIRPLAGITGAQVGRLDPEVVSIAQAQFGATAVDPFSATEATINGNPVTLGGAAFAVVARHGGVPFRDRRPSRAVFAGALAIQGVVINEPLATRTGLGEGDVVRIATSRGDLTRRIEGVFLDYSRHLGLVVVDRADYLRLAGDEGPQQIAIFLAPGETPATARQRLSAALGGRFLIETLLAGELRAEVLRAFDRTFAITSALQIVAAVVAVLAVVTVLYALLDERRRDLAVIRTLGASRGQMIGLIAGQAGLLGSTGAAIGGVAGLAVGWVLVKVVNLQSFGWTLEFLPPWGRLAATAATVVVACGAAGVLPALAAMRVGPQEALRETG